MMWQRVQEYWQRNAGSMSTYFGWGLALREVDEENEHQQPHHLQQSAFIELIKLTEAISINQDLYATIKHVSGHQSKYFKGMNALDCNLTNTLAQVDCCVISP